MRIRRTLCVAVSALVLFSPAAYTQSSPPKTIGQTQHHSAALVPSLIVMNARGAALQGGRLTLTGIAPNSIVFADRPHRAAGHDLTARLLEEWAPGNTSADSFTKDPPNATVSAFKKDGSGVLDAVVVLKTPKLEGERLTFDVDVLEGDLAGADGPASIFIDIIGRPLTPLSFAGVARRSAWRGAWYAGAAGTAAAAAYFHPYAYGYRPYAYPPYRPACGYYPLPPCY